MSRYNFVSPGASAGKAIEEFFIQQALQQRQAMLDDAAQQKQADEVRQRDEQLRLQREQEARIAKAQADSNADLDTEREFRRASTIHTNALPGVLDPGTADLLKRQGFGDIVTQGAPSQGAPQFDPTQINDIPQYDVIPGVLETKGGTAYQQARAAEAARAEQAQAAQAAAAERAAADRASREAMAGEANATRQAIAGLAASGRNANIDLDRQIKQLKIDSETQKKDDAAQATRNSAKAQQELGQGILSELDRLQTQTPDKKGYALSPGAQSITGPARVPGIVAGLGLPFMGKSSNATAALKGLVAKLDINKLRELKAQSKTGATGFGALSERELAVIENAAAMLDTAQTEAVFNERLNEIRAAAQKLVTAGGTTLPAPGGGSVTIKSIVQLP